MERVSLQRGDIAMVEQRRTPGKLSEDILVRGPDSRLCENEGALSVTADGLDISKQALAGVSCGASEQRKRQSGPTTWKRERKRKRL